MAHAARKLSAIVTFIIFFTISAFAGEKQYAGLAVAIPVATSDEIEVDLELVMAVDVSGSMQEPERRLQRDGYAVAFKHPDLIQAILIGRHKRIAVTYFEWSYSGYHPTVQPWTLIDSAWSASVFGSRLEESPLGPENSNGTSIAAALAHAGTLFEGNGFKSARQTVDISGDGVNNGGGLQFARNALLAQGITINGLPIILNPDIPGLASYYEECVIGGESSFIVSVQKEIDFAEATRMKLVTEISQRNELFNIAKPRIVLVSDPREETFDCD